MWNMEYGTVVMMLKLKRVENLFNYMYTLFKINYTSNCVPAQPFHPS